MNNLNDSIIPVEREEEQADTRKTFSRRFLDLIRQGDLGALPVIIGLILIVAYFTIRTNVFLTPRNISNLILQSSALAAIALGAVLVLVIAESDLGSGPLSALTAAVTALLITEHQIQAPLAILAGLAAGCLCGIVVGLIITKIGVPSFVVTLGASLVYNGGLLIILGTGGSVLVRDPLVVGIATSFLPKAVGWVIVVLAVLVYAGSALENRKRRLTYHLPVENLNEIIMHILFIALIAATIVAVLNAERGVPVIGVIIFVLVVLVDVVMLKTPFGRHLYTVGGNPEAARRAGINVTRLRIIVFAISSALSAFGGIILTSRSSSVSTASGGGDLTLNAIASAIIGGVSMFGGRGRAWAAILGAFVIGSALNGMDLLSVGSGTKFVVIGIILVTSVSIDALSRKQRQASGRF